MKLIGLAGQQVVRLPDGRLHLISAIAPQKSAGTASSSSVPGSQTLPASTPRPTAAPRTLLIGSQRFLLSNPTGAQTLLLGAGGVGGQKVVSGLSRPQLMLTSPASQSTVIRMPSGQHIMLRASQPGSAPVTPASQSTTGLSTATHSLLSAAGKTPPSTPYAVTPEVVQHGN